MPAVPALDERHTLSDPRPAAATDGSAPTPRRSGLDDDDDNDWDDGEFDRESYRCDLPGWHVDVYRRGVSDPVDTLLINDETLPPRTNRKGKAVWRLPGDVAKLVSCYLLLIKCEF